MSTTEFDALIDHLSCVVAGESETSASFTQRVFLHVDPTKIANYLIELRALLTAEPVAWRCEGLILPGVSIIEDREHALRRMKQPEAWKVTPLYPAGNLALSDGLSSDRDSVLVPCEPSKAMLDAAYQSMRLDPSCAPFSKRILLKGWDAMLAAAPNPPTGGRMDE